MEKVKIEKDVFVRDQYGVRRRAFVAGTEVEKVVYDATFKTNTPVDAKALPQEPEEVEDKLGVNLLKDDSIENKMLPEEAAEKPKNTAKKKK